MECPLCPLSIGFGNLSYSLIPKAVLSLKVLQELPIIVVLMYQLYKKQVHMEVAEFIPLIMNTISLVPSQPLRQSPAFNKDVLVDFKELRSRR